MYMAGEKLYLATAKIWDHFFENFGRLQSYEDCIAENPDNNRSLYLTANGIFPELILYGPNNRPIIWRPVRSKDECSTAAFYMITRYIVGDTSIDVPKIVELPMSKPVDTKVKDVEPDEDDEEQHILDTIYEREDELSKAMGDFLAVVLLEEDYNAVIEGYGEEFLNNLVDDFLQRLYDDHQISVYRPTLITDEETNCEILAEYPYGWDDEYEDVK